VRASRAALVVTCGRRQLVQRAIQPPERQQVAAGELDPLPEDIELVQVLAAAFHLEVDLGGQFFVGKEVSLYHAVLLETRAAEHPQVLSNAPAAGTRKRGEPVLSCRNTNQPPE